MQAMLLCGRVAVCVRGGEVFVHGLERDLDLRTGFFLGDEWALEEGETFGLVRVLVVCHLLGMGSEEVLGYFGTQTSKSL